jgi:hypothetical protein
MPNCSHISSVTKADTGLKPLVEEAATPWGGHGEGPELGSVHVQPFTLASGPKIMARPLGDTKTGKTVQLPFLPDTWPRLV